MTDSNPLRQGPDLDRLFERAVSLSGPARERYLQEACGDDADLRAELGRLLSAIHADDSFLEDGLQGWSNRDDVPNTGDAPRPGSPLAAGRRVEHYEIESILGAGGMGVVYRARDTRLGRQVALKFLQSHLTTTPEARRRFVQEAQAASALDHPNICTIHEIQETDDGQVFIAMTYYPGETLRARLARSPMSMAESLRIASAIADGLGRAHEAGIVHRDLKPANVILTERGEVKLLDFGIAKLEGGVEITRTGARLGTVAYMSPEQSQGDVVDACTDIWSLGVVLAEMLTATRPFHAPSERDLLKAIADGSPTCPPISRPG